MFKTVERLVRKQPWYKSNRTQIVAYSIALLHYSIRKKFPKTELDLLKIWKMQYLPERLVRLLEGIAKQVNDNIFKVIQRGDNASTWCKQQTSWVMMCRDVWIGLPINLTELMLDAQELQARRRAAEDAQCGGETSVEGAHPETMRAVDSIARSSQKRGRSSAVELEIQSLIGRSAAAIPAINTVNTIVLVPAEMSPNN